MAAVDVACDMNQQLLHSVWVAFLYNFSLPPAPDDDDVEWDELWVECGRRKEWRRVKKLQQLEINLKGLYSMSFNVV